jgi:hypothetical protein
MSDTCTINDDSRSINYINIMTLNDTASRQNDDTNWSATYWRL